MYYIEESTLLGLSGAPIVICRPGNCTIVAQPCNINFALRRFLKLKNFFHVFRFFSNLGIFVSQPWDIVILSGNLAFQVADDAMQMDVHKTLNPF